MAKRDMASVKRDMLECIQFITSTFKANDVPLEATPIVQLAETMFNDYRGNSARDIAEHEAEAALELLRLKHQLDKVK